MQWEESAQIRRRYRLVLRARGDTTSLKNRAVMNSSSQRASAGQRGGGKRKEDLRGRQGGGGRRLRWMERTLGTRRKVWLLHYHLHAHTHTVAGAAHLKVFVSYHQGE